MSDLIERLRTGADNIECARKSGVVEELAGWEHRAIRAAINRIAELEAENARLRGLLARNIDDEPCWRDHHGYCQTHYLEEDCSVAAARAALKEIDNG